MREYFRLLQYARPHRASWIFIGALTLASVGLVALQPWPMKVLADHVLGEGPLADTLDTVPLGQWLPSSRTALLMVVVAGGLLLLLLNTAVNSALAWRWTATGRRMVYEVAEDLFARLQRCPLSFHQKLPSADLMSRVTVDNWAVYQVADTLAFAPAHALLTFGATVLLMAQLDGRLTLITLALAPATVGASFLLGKPLRAAAKLKREIEARIQAHLQQTLTGIPVVQAFAQEEHEMQRFRSFADAAIRSQQRSAILGSVNSLSSGLVTTLGSGVVLWVGSREVLEGTLSLGSILVFLVYLGSLQAQVKVFAGTYSALQGLSASTRRVVEVLDASPQVVGKRDVLAPALRGAVEFVHVGAGYDAGVPVLKDISLQVRAGQTIAIVGPTGAGKTTLVNLIPRFLEVTSGLLLIDGHDIQEVRLECLRRQIGLVLQDSLLFPLSIRENIAYGRPDAGLAEIEAAARDANAHEFIVTLPEGYDTVIGERGATLSGGQRQRLAIARALLKNPAILILDEPTSALDSETEHLILEALQRLMNGRTTFVIGHRLSTVRRADRIVVLNAGRIVETGDHEELLRSQGQYARLHRLQFTRS